MKDIGRFDISHKLGFVVSAVNNNQAEIYTEPVFLSDAEQNEMLEKRGSRYTSCILGAICEDFFYYDTYSNSIFFAQKNSLSDLPTYIMMSATADSFVCKKLFNRPYKFNFYECSKARYKGRVRLISDETYSRSCFAENPDLIGKIVAKHPDDCYITFKNHISDIHAEDSCKLYFGKAIGTNSFTGRNITIIGTPHKPAYAYILFAEKTGYQVQGQPFDEKNSGERL